MSKRITDLSDILHNASFGEVEHLDALGLSLNGSRAAAGALLIADRV